MVFQFLRDTGFSPQEAPFWFIFLFAGIAGFCAFQARKLARRNAVLRKSLEETRVSLAEKSVRADAASENEAALSEERKRRESLEAEIAATAAQMAERERMFADQQNRLQTEFKALSNDLLQGAHKSFLQRADETFQRYRDNAASESEKRRKAIDDMLKPVSETLHRYEKGLADMRAQQEKARGELHGQIGALAQSTHHVRAEAQKLANALRAGPKTRGRWGEEQLRNVVEIAGMQAHVDFVEQESHTDGERRKQPDMVVRLPGDRVVAVDSKVSLSAYLDAIDAETDELRIQRMRQHAEDLWSHVKALSAKDYAASLRDSLDYVIMFVPGENYYAAALDVRPQLYQD
ncbi:MAG: DNA recombination protein RmuC, partial [Pseudomonadota bacterium]